MKISIVILNWNGAGMLRRFLPSVLECSEGADVIVADNGSEDDSLQVLAHDFPQVRTIVMNHNYGFAEGYNVALRQVDSDIYVLLMNACKHAYQIAESLIQAVTFPWRFFFSQNLKAPDFSGASVCIAKKKSANFRNEQ